MNLFTDPWSWWVEPFLDNSFLRDALFAGILAVICTSLVGTWVVIRQLSFFADALSHGVLPGIAVAFILGGNVTLGALVAALVMILGINSVRRFSPLPQDVGIALLFVGMLALAIVIMSRQSSYIGDANRFLFGSVLGITNQDLIIQGSAAVLVVSASFLFYRALLAAAFDSTLARLLKLRPGLVEIGLMLLLAISIVASFKVVGSLLVFAFLIAPPATAALICSRVWTMMFVSVGVGCGALILGLLISVHHELAASATMALTTVVIFFVVMIGKILFRQPKAAFNFGG